MKNIIRNLFLLFIMSNIISAQESNFILSTQHFLPYFPTYIGNGYFSLSSSQLATTASESYMIAVYDHGKDDIPRIACLPSWNEINYFNGSKWLNDSAKDLMKDSLEFSSYKQTLDMYNGLLETSYRWTTGQKVSELGVVSFVSRSNKNLAVIKLDLKTNFTDTVKLLFPLSEREPVKRMPLARLEKIEPDTSGNWPKPWYPGFISVLSAASSSLDENDINIHMLSKCDGRNTKVALAAEILFENLQKPLITSQKTPGTASIEIKFLAEKGKNYTFYKLVSAASDNTEKAQTNIEKMVRENCKQARAVGYNKLLTDHKSAWNKLWETNIVVKGDDNFQRVIHSMMYYLLSSIAENTDFSLPPMGLSSSGYYGHVFWDADTYMFPPLLLMHPDMARSMVSFRFNTLKAAQDNARKNNYKGAMYPWESDEIGEETTPFFAYQNALRENHIVGDVALAQWQYFLATKDTNYLRQKGAKVIFSTADFWTSRVNYNKKKDRYEIGKLVSVSESMKDVNNETYTNTVAKINLEIAQRVSDILKTKKNPDWEKVSKKMFIPFDEKNQYHPTYENALPGTKESTEFWTSVAPLLSFPLQLPMSKTAKRNDFLNAVRGLEEIGAGANMGINFLPIIAAELGNDSLFNLTLEKTYKGFLRAPFNVLAETHTNHSVNFITGAGAFLQQVIFGYTGLRLTEEGLTKNFEPMLPKNISSMRLINFSFKNMKYNISVEGKNIKLEPLR
ncbi:MAG: hypothetical protein Q8933_01310 [Bacteroidota bacterium]|nr:hypothetical protein [Bacteroidota bacterium]MDP4193675.1 hypothetical protein [Bacteroidota bacterium]